MTQTPTALQTRFENEVIRIEPTPKWIRGVVNGVTIADSKRAVLMFEKGHVPAYYIPESDVRLDLTEPTDHHTHCPRKGDASYYSLKVGDHVVENALWYYPKPTHTDPSLSSSPDMRGYVSFYWNKVDHWFEEDEEVYVHARDPYKRVDVAQSSRHVQVTVDGEAVAETRRPVLLFETGLPVRYYIPLLDVKLDALAQSEKVTACPYKGQASYYSMPALGERGQDIAWYYRTPIAGVEAIAGHVAFFNERVDIAVDGETQERPQTRWSPK